MTIGRVDSNSSLSSGYAASSASSTPSDSPLRDRVAAAVRGVINKISPKKKEDPRIEGARREIDACVATLKRCATGNDWFALLPVRKEGEDLRGYLYTLEALAHHAVMQGENSEKSMRNSPWYSKTEREAKADEIHLKVETAKKELTKIREIQDKLSSPKDSSFFRFR